MPNLVQNFHDARRKIAAASEAIAQAQKAIDDADVALTWMEDVLGPLPEIAQGQTTASQPDPADTWVSRILQLLNDNGGGPYTAAQLRDMYKDKRLKGYEKSNLYSSIFNTLIYLKEKDVLQRTPQGYQINPSELSFVPIDNNFVG